MTVDAKIVHVSGAAQIPAPDPYFKSAVGNMTFRTETRHIGSRKSGIVGPVVDTPDKGIGINR
jgi:hypothetical protein